LDFANNNEVTNNTINWNNQGGIWLWNSNRNIITANDIGENNKGIRLDGDENVIYHNNFRDNVIQAEDNGRGNSWIKGYPAGGNYWSDYDEASEGAIDVKSGPDQNQAGSDGIADSPYDITGDAGAKDDYPLMHPWGEQLPELSISPEDISLPNENPTWGDMIDISAIIDNTGNRAAKEVSVKFYYNTREFNPDNPEYIFHEIITDIPANQKKEIKAPWVVSRDVPIFIHVTVDLPSEIKETEDFTNNYAIKEIQPNSVPRPKLKGNTRIIVIPVYIKEEGKPKALDTLFEKVDNARKLLRIWATERGVKDEVSFEEFAVVDKTESQIFTEEESKAKVSYISSMPNPWDYWVDEAARNIGFDSAAEIWYLAKQQVDDNYIVICFALDKTHGEIAGMSYEGWAYATFEGPFGGKDYGEHKYGLHAHEFLHKFGANDQYDWGKCWSCSIMFSPIDFQAVPCLCYQPPIHPHPNLDDDTAKEIGWSSESTHGYLNLIALCPVDLEIIDPEGIITNKQINEIPGATYTETDISGDGDPDDIIIIPDRKIGDFQITVTPEPDAEPTDIYTLEVMMGDTTTVLAENVPVSEIPTEPYIFKSGMA
jgi:parallel beta-helix repeat protein